MRKMTAAHKGLIKDFAWYSASSFLPMAVGLFRTPVFTRHFGPDDFGSLGIVQVTFSYLGMFLFSWISSCLWRYYQRYRKESRSGQLNGGLMLFFGASFLLLLLFSAAWYALTGSELMRELIVLSFFHLIFSQILMAYLVIVRMEERASLYTAVQSLRALLAFGLSLYLVFRLNAGIPALVTGLAVVDGLVLLLMWLWNPVGLEVRVRGMKTGEMKELLSYGMAGLVMNVSLLTLNLSDRYVILYSEGLVSVGIYDQVYKISQLSVSALVAVFFNVINPGLFRKLEESFEGSLPGMARYLRFFLLLGLPVVVYLSLFSELLSDVLLGAAFREAYRMMPFVFFAAFLQGVSNFFELRMKFSNQLRRLGLVFLAAAVLNLVLNLLFVPVYGYYWAAVSTLLTVLLVIIYLAMADRALLSSLRPHAREFAGFAGLLALQALVFIAVDNFDPSLSVVIAMGLIFVLSYAGLLSRSGLLND